MKCETITTVEQMRSACRLSACTRHSIVEVNVVIGVLLCGLLVGVRVVPIVVCDAVVLIHFILIALYRIHCFHVEFP